MAEAFIRALLFGLVVAASIGPIALLILSLSARRGLAAGAAAGFGAAVADFLYALLAFSAGAVLLPLLAAQATAIRTGSALLLVALGAWLLLRRRPAPGVAAAPGRGPAFLSTLLLTLVNPMTLVLFAGFVPQLPVAGTPGLAALLAFALFLGSLAVQLALAAFGAWLGRASPRPAWRRAIDVAGALGILGFGLAGLAAAAG